ncbi:hypothetical protein AB0H83_33040 [Dactylosporangium sp. NPDC050688]|uniref:hypothetical protein n=1 Tax=Dactylosporangium sp. NPDC050688 TaxID=3157217 RepID=UPI0033F15ECC
MSSTPERAAWPSVVALIGLAVGGLLLCGGLFRAPWSDEVDCGGRSMKPGDRCISSNNSSTYEERREVRDNGVWFLVAGGIAVAGSLVTLAARRRPGQG